eukprot:354300-Pyramimonas_sp.AAC.1
MTELPASLNETRWEIYGLRAWLGRASTCVNDCVLMHSLCPYDHICGLTDHSAPMPAASVRSGHGSLLMTLTCPACRSS